MKPFYDAIAWLVVHIHGVLAPVFGSASGAAAALSIVLLTIAMRLLLFPLFVKQIRSQRVMQTLQPKMKELQAKYKNDKERLNQEMMALWKESGANPLSGCLPLIVQIPVFFALFRVLNSIKPNAGVAIGTDCTSPRNFATCFSSHYGISVTDVAHFANAKVFGVPISAAFNSSSQFLHLVAGNSTSTRVLTVILIVLMGASTFLTQRQLMARTAATGVDNPMAQQQKILLYVLPLTFAVFGYRFPLGVLLYWLTTNLWSMGQQAFVIRRMDTGPTAAAPAGPAGPPPGARPVRPSGRPTPPAPPAGTTVPAKSAPPGRPANRNRRNRRGRR